MDMIQGAEWIIVAVFVAGTVWFVYLLVSVQGDMRVEESGTNTDEEAKAMFLELVNCTRKSIDIHDDGEDFPESVYNCSEVLNAFRERIEKNPNLRIRCLFNDKEPNLGLLELAKSEKYRKNIEIWYSKGERPTQDVHYKIVDGGSLVHLSVHAHGDSERDYRLRRAQRFWEGGTRRRISRRYQENFDQALKGAIRAE